MKKPIIAVDIDEVLFPNVPTLLPFYNKVSGTDIRQEQMKTYFIEDITGETLESILGKIEAYLKTEHYNEGQPIEGSIESIKKLRERFKLVLVTSRQHFWRGVTEEFINTHFEDQFDELHYTHTVKSPNDDRPKLDICVEIGAELLIDDSLSNVTKCAAGGIKAILFGDYPWNQTDKLPIGVTRCKDWPAVLEYFDAKYR